MPDRREFEDASVTMSLGALADHALSGVLRAMRDQPIAERQRLALESVERLFEAVAEFDSPTMSAGPIFESISSVGALDETLEIVTSLRASDEDPAAAARRLSEMVKRILKDSAQETDFQAVKSLLDQLASTTLARSADLTYPFSVRATRGPR